MSAVRSWKTQHEKDAETIALLKAERDSAYQRGYTAGQEAQRADSAIICRRYADECKRGGATHEMLAAQDCARAILALRLSELEQMTEHEAMRAIVERHIS